MYRKVQFFFSVLYFFINLVCNESLYYCNSCMLEKISYLGKFWFLRYGPKCSLPIRLRDFSINRRTLNMAAFVFYCDAKHSDTLLGSSHVCCCLFLGGCGQKWAWPFRSWNSEICCISRVWIDKMSWLFCMLIQI